MKDVEIVVFNDKSWVRLIEYQKLDEELKNEKQSLAKRIYELQSDLSRAKSMNEKMQNCANCDYWFDLDSTCELTNKPIYDFMVDCGCKSWKCAYKMDNEELKKGNEIETEWSNRIEELKTDLEYAKAIIIDLLNNSHEYAIQNAEDFIKGEKK